MYNNTLTENDVTVLKAFAKKQKFAFAVCHVEKKAFGYYLIINAVAACSPENNRIEKYTFEILDDPKISRYLGVKCNLAFVVSSSGYNENFATAKADVLQTALCYSNDKNITKLEIDITAA